MGHQNVLDDDDNGSAEARPSAAAAAATVAATAVITAGNDIIGSSPEVVVIEPLTPPASGSSTCSSGSASTITEESHQRQQRNRIDAADEEPAADEVPRERLGLEDFEILKVLGRGAFGKVFQVRIRPAAASPDTEASWRRPGNVFALKTMKKSRIVGSQTDVRHTMAERDTLAAVSHPFIVKLHCAFETQDRLYLVQEFCCGGELFRRLEVEQLMMEKDAIFYLSEIILALDYLHSLDVVYRDLKTENVMLDARGHIKLVDFGFCKMDMADGVLTKTFCGTVEYMAPEVVLNGTIGYGKPADWWSLGIFTFDLLTGRSPFYSTQGKAATKERILKGKFPTPRILTPNANDFIRRLLRRNIVKRLGSAGAREIKGHALFGGVDWTKVLKQEYAPPFRPEMRNSTDVQNFDVVFTSQPARMSSTSDTPQQQEAVQNSADLFKDFYFESEEFAAPSTPARAKVNIDEEGLGSHRGEKVKNNPERSTAKFDAGAEEAPSLTVNPKDGLDGEGIGLKDMKICSFGHV